MFLKTTDANLFVSDWGLAGGNTLVAHGGCAGRGEFSLEPFEPLPPLTLHHL
jgi:hypothetical protein